jgi:hypothetical protein
VSLDLYAIQDRLEHWERGGSCAYREDVAALMDEVERLRAALEGLGKPVPYPDERWRPACIDCAESQRVAREALEGGAAESEPESSGHVPAEFPSPVAMPSALADGLCGDCAGCGEIAGVECALCEGRGKLS